jgi:transcriptional regulator with GAF, ATPase, and Fis domain
MRARLTVEAGEARPDTLDLEPTQAASLGRSRDNTVVLRSEHASRLHSKVFFEDGRWQVQDFSLNGTWLNGERVPQKADLSHGQEIRIGEIRLRFQLPEQTTTSSSSRAPQDRKSSKESNVHLSTSFLHASESSILCTFMASHAGAEEPVALLKPALQLLLSQSNAYVAGYLSPDAADPLPKVVVPEGIGIDHALSRQLTRRSQRDSRSVWLGTEVGESHPADLLKEVTDALCVPVRSLGLALGMLHIYKRSGLFVDRDLRFAEAMADYLGGSLRGFQQRHNLNMEVARLRTHAPAVDELIGDSAPMVRLRQQIAKVAAQPVPVLIRGEPGVGADVVALYLHRQSPRTSGPFVYAPCSSTAPSLVEGDLFGRRSGMSGVETEEPGYCRAADEGTLFVDEITLLTPDCQSKMQRLIDDKCFRPVGAATDVRADVRVIAATRADLETLVAENQFRKALFERINRVVIEVPPLRTHLDDVPYLVQYFLDKLALDCRRQVTMTSGAMRKLQAYFWPGNHRQLRAELEAAVLRASKDVIDEGDVLVGCERLLLAR